MEKPLSVTLSALVNENKILLIKRLRGHFPGLWGLPGGKVENNEHIEQSAIREIEEESGIDSQFISHLGVVSEHVIEDGEINHIILHVCELKPKNTAFQNRGSGELMWFDLDTIDNYKDIVVPSDMMMIEHLVKKRSKSYYNSVIERVNGFYVLRKFENMNKYQEEKIIIDIGSSTVKAYLCSQENIKNILQKSLHLKENFDPELGINDYSKRELFNIISSIKTRYDNEIKIYSTAVFRNMVENTRKDFEKEFFNTTGLHLNIIDQERESCYLQKALVGRCFIKEPILLMNTGGGSTQVILVENKIPIEKINIQIGVGTINSMFSGIKEQLSSASLDEIVKFVRNQIPKISKNAKFAFNTGGELSFMRLTAYPIVDNVYFTDRDHPKVIAIKDFQNKNKEIFENITLGQLESMMPENPSWMHGTRAYLAISQAICEKYGVETIIPSDSNIIHGIVREEFS